MADPPSDLFVKKAQFTKTVYRDVYPTVDPTNPANSMAGKVIVITGPSKGLGRLGFVKSFAKAGPKAIVLVSRNEAGLKQVRDEIKEIDKDVQVEIIPTDIKSAESVTSFWEKVKEKFGHADVLVNNAASVGGGTVADQPLDSWWNDFETNVKGTFLVTQGFLKLLGTEKKGAIISLTTFAAHMPFPGLSAYSISKLALTQLQAFIAVENPNVTAVAIHPGLILTDATLDYFKPFAKDSPELLGGLGVWLATENASFLSGKYVEVNWSVDELIERKDEIVKEGKLSIGIKGEFGSEQFE
ncbi:putative oxidoreductase ucpA [Hyaloscypha variabilis]